MRGRPASTRGIRDHPVDVHDWLQALFQESPVAIGFSRDGVMLDANAAYLRLFGYETAAELRGRSLLDHLAPTSRAQVLATIRERAAGGSPPKQ